MIRTVNYSSIDRVALRQKGWKWFAVVMGLQLLMIACVYLIT
ncbi:KGW motif small protein [Acinetobacter sp. ULE_I010]